MSGQRESTGSQPSSSEEAGELRAEIAEILATHHEPSKVAAVELTRALARAPMALRQDWAAMRALYEDHLGKEEVLLFPAIEALERGDESAVHHILGPIAQMHVEHAQLGELEQRIRGRLDQAGDAAASLEAFLDDLEIHAGREDRGLFRQALARAMGVPVDEVDLDELVGGLGGAPSPRSAEPVAAPSPSARGASEGRAGAGGGRSRRGSLLRRAVRRLFRSR